MSNIDTSSWKEFRLDELFSAESGDFDIKKEHINGLGVDVVTAGETENGILGKSDIMAKVFDGNTITIDMFGKCTYRPDCYKMVTHAYLMILMKNQDFILPQCYRNWLVDLVIAICVLGIKSKICQ